MESNSVRIELDSDLVKMLLKKYKNFLFVIIALFFGFLPGKTGAFIPPDLMQGISAGFSAISTAVAFLVSGIIIFFGVISLIFKKHRKLFFILIIENIILIAICTGVFHLKYYKPLSAKFNSLAEMRLSENQNSKYGQEVEVKTETNELDNNPKK